MAGNALCREGAAALGDALQDLVDLDLSEVEYISCEILGSVCAGVATSSSLCSLTLQQRFSCPGIEADCLRALGHMLATSTSATKVDLRGVIAITIAVP